MGLGLGFGFGFGFGLGLGLAHGAHPERTSMQHVQRRVHVLHGPLATLPEQVAIGTLLITPGSLGLG